MEHKSVLLDETIDLMGIEPNGIYVDGTLGRGGHAAALSRKLQNGKLYAFDKDAAAFKESMKALLPYSDKIVFIHSDFRCIKEQLAQRGVYGVDGVMLDLGVSSPQFDDASRGFSYRFDSRLDMRMDQSQAKDACQVVNTYSVDELTRIFKEYGEERYARSIAQAIERSRKEAPIVTTGQLVDVVRQALPNKELRKKGHPAKQTFQALRIEVNDELGALRQCLIDVMELLNPGGRCAVITFHSLEDRTVKSIFKEYSSAPFVEPRLPLTETQMEQASFHLVTKKPVVPQEDELIANNRAHSAKLRVIERNSDV